MLWKIRLPADTKLKARIAGELDAVLREFLAKEVALTAADLKPEQKVALAEKCGALLISRLVVDIPTDLVRARAEDASVFLGIREAYIYRDWQAAIGDAMIREVVGGSRRFDIVGFGEYEAKYLASRSMDPRTPERRGFNRVEWLIADLDMNKSGMFDARREQVKRLKEACESLLKFLDEKRKALAPRGGGTA